MVDHVLAGVKQVNHLITNYLTLSTPTRPVKKLTRLDLLLKDALGAAAESPRPRAWTLKSSARSSVRWSRPIRNCSSRSS